MSDTLGAVALHATPVVLGYDVDAVVYDKHVDAEHKIPRFVSSSDRDALNPSTENVQTIYQ